MSNIDVQLTTLMALVFGLWNFVGVMLWTLATK